MQDFLKSFCDVSTNRSFCGTIVPHQPWMAIAIRVSSAKTSCQYSSTCMMTTVCVLSLQQHKLVGSKNTTDSVTFHRPTVEWPFMQHNSVKVIPIRL